MADSGVGAAIALATRASRASVLNMMAEWSRLQLAGYLDITVDPRELNRDDSSRNSEISMTAGRRFIYKTNTDDGKRKLGACQDWGLSSAKIKHPYCGAAPQFGHEPPKLNALRRRRNITRCLLRVWFLFVDCGPRRFLPGSRGCRASGYRSMIRAREHFSCGHNLLKETRGAAAKYHAECLMICRVFVTYLEASKATTLPEDVSKDSAV